MIARAKRRLIELLYLKMDWGAPPGKMHPAGYCIEPHCRWPYHMHEFLGSKGK